MKDVNPEPLTGTVEIDESYVGGKPPKGSKRGRGTPKQIVIGIRQRHVALRFFHAADVKSGTLAKYIKENVSGDVDVIVTDDFSAYHKALGELDSKHATINHSGGNYAIDHMILGKLHEREEGDWTRFGKMQIETEARLKES